MELQERKVISHVLQSDSFFENFRAWLLSPNQEYNIWDDRSSMPIQSKIVQFKHPSLIDPIPGESLSRIYFSDKTLSWHKNASYDWDHVSQWELPYKKTTGRIYEKKAIYIPNSRFSLKELQDRAEPIEYIATLWASRPKKSFFFLHSEIGIVKYTLKSFMCVQAHGIMAETYDGLYFRFGYTNDPREAGYIKETNTKDTTHCPK
jgi:hypothetical protein